MVIRATHASCGTRSKARATSVRMQAEADWTSPSRQAPWRWGSISPIRSKPTTAWREDTGPPACRNPQLRHESDGPTQRVHRAHDLVQRGRARKGEYPSDPFGRCGRPHERVVPARYRDLAED